MNWKSVFYGKLTRTTIPKILSVSLLTTKEHPYKVKKNPEGSFFIINDKLNIKNIDAKKKLNLHIYGIEPL